MKSKICLFITAAFSSVSLLAQDPGAPPPNWHARTLGEALLYMALFTMVGVALAIISYKAFDICTPGNLQKEIVENKNVAAALIGGAVIIGACIIVAAAMIG